MANVWEKTISILSGNLKLGCSYLITTVIKVDFISDLECMKDTKYIFNSSTRQLLIQICVLSSSLETNMPQRNPEVFSLVFFSLDVRVSIWD